MITTLACSNNWLDAAPQAGMTNASHTGGTTLAVGQAFLGQSTNCIDYGYHHWPYYNLTVTSPARPIKLLLSEVERLRKAAKADEKLKAILQKFTSQIEITVDFE